MPRLHTVHRLPPLPRKPSGLIPHSSGLSDPSDHPFSLNLCLTLSVSRAAADGELVQVAVMVVVVVGMVMVALE